MNLLYVFPEAVGKRIWAALWFARHKELAFLCGRPRMLRVGVRKERGPHRRCSPSGPSHLGRQTERETVPLTPLIFYLAGPGSNALPRPQIPTSPSGTLTSLQKFPVLS